MSWSLKPDRDSRRHLERTRVGVAALFKAVSIQDRGLIAAEIAKKTPSASLNKAVVDLVKCHSFGAGYAESIREVVKTEWTADAVIAKSFLEECLWEFKYSANLSIDSLDEEIYRAHGYLSLIGTQQASDFLDELHKWLALQDFDQITAEPPSYRHSPGEKEILERGQALFRSKNYLEALKLPIDKLHADPRGKAFSVLCLLARERPETLIDFLPRLIDPVVWGFLLVVAQRNSKPLALSHKLLKAKHPSVIWFGLDLGLKVLNSFSRRYAGANVAQLGNAKSIVSRREETLRKAYKEIWSLVIESQTASSIVDWIDFKDIFDIRLRSHDDSPANFLKIGEEVFMQAGQHWLGSHPNELNVLSGLDFKRVHDVDLIVKWIGEFFERVDPSLFPKSDVLGVFQRIHLIFKDRIFDEETRFRGSITYPYQIYEANAWIHFYNGAIVLLGWEAVSKAFFEMLRPVENELRTIWKPSAHRYGAHACLSYSILIILKALQGATDGAVSPAQLQQILRPIQGMPFGQEICSNVIGNILTTLAQYFNDPSALSFIENVVLGEGARPLMVNTVPEIFLQTYPHLSHKAKAMLEDYGDFYFEEMEDVRPSLKSKGILSGNENA